MPRPSTPAIERVLRRTIIDPDSGCWIWQGALNHGGYGIVQLGRGIGTQRTHIVVYEAHLGPVPEGFTLDHVKARGCISNACCWPAHLEPVTRSENTKRQWASGHGNAGIREAEKTHCPQGHAYDEANTRITKKGQRACRACARAKSNAHYYATGKAARQERSAARAGLAVVDASEAVDIRERPDSTVGAATVALASSDA